MKTISHPLFLVLATCYAVYYGLKQTDVVLPVFITSYLADLLSIFLVNTFALWIIRKMKNSPKLEVPIAMVFLSVIMRSEEHTSELQSRPHLVCRLLLEKKILCHCTCID